MKNKGNMLRHHNNGPNIRHFCWTEDNRLQATQDNTIPAFYNYDASGERNLKLTGAFIDMYINGQMAKVPVLSSQVLYANALVTINDKGYTKHYFEEGKRICSAIGGGGLNGTQAFAEPIEADFNMLKNNLNNGLQTTFTHCLPNMVVNINVSDFYNDVVKPNEQIITNVEPHYYYLTDHLGSFSYIVNDQAQITQTLAYMPWGEDFVNINTSTPDELTPFRFNGKEKDEETGFNYFGARYYYDYLSIWLSVDPMFAKYPHISNYSYCSNNPVMKIDPDGRDEWELNTKTGQFTNVGTKGGDKTDYYYTGQSQTEKNEQTGKQETKFVRDQTIEIARDGKNNINSFRIEETDRYTISAFHIPDAKDGELSSGFFLEPKGPSTEKSGQNQRIPEGSYNVTKHSGTNYQNVLKLYNDDVSKDRAILIHNGNSSVDTRGCLLIGNSKSTNYVGDSRNTLNRLRNYVDKRNVSNIRVNVNNIIKK
ncbi:MAG: DUF5675 family protein [Bacteroidales bacterium]|nr:DUF5675 family protein [Bacteroidales bacterium]